MRISSFSAASGFTLIEVLVAALVMGIGLLGFVSLQTRALQYNQQAYLYSQAVFLAQDIGERMRSNPAAADHYKTDFGDTISGVTATTCLDEECSADKMAKWDLKIWKENLAASLPQGDGRIIEVEPVGSHQYQITIRFDDSHGDLEPRSLPPITIQLL